MIDLILDQQKGKGATSSSIKLCKIKKIIWEFDEKDLEDDDKHKANVLSKMLRVTGQIDMIQKYIHGDAVQGYGGEIVDEEVHGKKARKLRQKLMQSGWKYIGNSVTSCQIARTKSAALIQRITYETFVKYI